MRRLLAVNNWMNTYYHSHLKYTCYIYFKDVHFLSIGILQVGVAISNRARKQNDAQTKVTDAQASELVMLDIIFCRYSSCSMYFYNTTYCVYVVATIK